jgi:hypothetical protein
VIVLPGQDSRDMSARTGKFVQVRLTGQPGQGSLGRAAWTGADRKMSARTGQPEQISRDRSARTGQPGQVSLDRSAGKISLDRSARTDQPGGDQSKQVSRHDNLS